MAVSSIKSLLCQTDREQCAAPAEYYCERLVYINPSRTSRKKFASCAKHKEGVYRRLPWSYASSTTETTTTETTTETTATPPQAPSDPQADPRTSRPTAPPPDPDPQAGAPPAPSKGYAAEQRHKNRRARRVIRMEIATAQKMCELCLRPFNLDDSQNWLHPLWEHCHVCGGLRGVVCHACNMKIEVYKTAMKKPVPVDWKERADFYLGRHDCSTPLYPELAPSRPIPRRQGLSQQAQSGAVADTIAPTPSEQL